MNIGILCLVEDILNVDESVMVADSVTDDDLVERFKPQPSTSHEQSESEDDTIVAEEPEPPQYGEMINAIKTMKRYLEAKADMTEELTMLYTLE